MASPPNQDCVRRSDDDRRDGVRKRPGTGYRRDRFTWAAFAALLAFGFLNAVLGPALPYLRAVEHIGYAMAALHQVAFAVGGGLAGLIAARVRDRPGRTSIIRLGLVGAAVAGLAIGYGDTAVVTVVAAFLVSLGGTSALVRLWAALADAHGPQRTTAMTEGEVAVSCGGIVCPLLVGGLAATALTWRFAFVIGAVIVVAADALFWVIRVPQPAAAEHHPPSARSGAGRRCRWPMCTLVVVFAVVALEFSLSFWLASYLADAVGLQRRLAVVMVAGLYAANLTGRLLASRLARHLATQRLLIASLVMALVGLPVLLAATGGAVAAAGLVIVGAGIGAAFPLTSSLHIGASPHSADRALGQVFTTAAAGQIVGPLIVGAIAQAVGLRLGLMLLPALAILAAAALVRHHATTPVASEVPR
ncbi:MAG: MFS transporter [Solirubrobacterales bacterium]|nr:MFS transporter [Solirubrobacterales bacterium]